MFQIHEHTGFRGIAMRYPAAIEPGTATTTFGVVFPDLPGCFSAGDTLDEAMQAAEEAVAAWLDASLEPFPAASSLDTLKSDPRFVGWTIASVSARFRDPAP